jgi:hypothetical protein
MIKCKYNIKRTFFWRCGHRNCAHSLANYDFHTSTCNTFHFATQVSPLHKTAVTLHELRSTIQRWVEALLRQNTMPSTFKDLTSLIIVLQNKYLMWTGKTEMDSMAANACTGPTALLYSNNKSVSYQTMKLNSLEEYDKVQI